MACYFFVLKMISCKISFGICWNLSFFSSVSAWGILLSSLGILHSSWGILLSSWSILHSSWGILLSSWSILLSFGLHNSVKRSEAKVSPTWGLARGGKALSAGKWPGKRR